MWGLALVIGLSAPPPAQHRHPSWWHFHHRPYPAWWRREAACIRSHEGTWTTNTGNGYFGAYQFLPSTWASVGGSVRPDLASPAEQTYRAHRVWERHRSWRHGQWDQSAALCGIP